MATDHKYHNGAMTQREEQTTSNRKLLELDQTPCSIVNCTLYGQLLASPDVEYKYLI